MKISLFSIFLGYSSLLLAFGEEPVNPAPMNSTVTPSADMHINESGSGKKKEENKKKPLASPEIPPPVRLPQQVAQVASYFHPGILVFQEGAWLGSDQLLNVPKNIGVYLTIVKPEDLKLEISENNLRGKAEEIFQKNGIKTQTLAFEGKPPLPAFEIEVFVYPIQKGFVASLNGRLFESVSIDRFKLDANMAFQAITWEKQSLLVAPTEQFSAELEKSIKDIAETFAERFKTYQKINM